MHLDFFGFNKDPFSATPDPEFLFKGASHLEALDSVLQNTANRKGLIVITGEAGVGKTAILRSYIEQTDPKKTKVINLMNVELTFDRLLEQMVCELGIAFCEGAPLKPLLLSRLADECKEGNTVVLIIDEAQNMPVETLELLRTLADMEYSGDKLLQIVLAGQPELDKKLNQPELRELHKIISIRHRIHPMSTKESLTYIEHRITKASSAHNRVFTKDALKQIVKEAGGIPRIINIICDNALINAFGCRHSPVTGQMVKKTILLFRGRRPGFFSSRKLAAVSSIASMAWRPPREIWPISKHKDAMTTAVAARGNGPVNVTASNDMGHSVSNRKSPPTNKLIVLAKTQFAKNPAKAEKLLYQAIASDPKNYEGYFQLGRLLTFKGDYGGAIREYREALRINNRLAAVHFNLGTVYLRLGRYDGARKCYERCFACSPSYKDHALTNLGVVEWKTGNTTRAQRLFLQAIRFNPGNKPARKYLGLLAARSRQATR